MSAKDYHICPSVFDAFIAKVSKKNPNLMLDDRREITDREIVELMIWYVKRECITKKGKDMTISEDGKPILYIEPRGRIMDEIIASVKEAEL